MEFGGGGIACDGGANFFRRLISLSNSSLRQGRPLIAAFDAAFVDPDHGPDR
jgi:hypothetical protein